MLFAIAPPLHLDSLSSCKTIINQGIQATLEIPRPEARAVIIVDRHEPQSRRRAALSAAFVAVGDACRVCRNGQRTALWSMERNRVCFAHSVDCTSSLLPIPTFLERRSSLRRLSSCATNGLCCNAHMGERFLDRSQGATIFVKVRQNPRKAITSRSAATAGLPRRG